MSIFSKKPKKTPYQIGLEGTPEEFLAANKRAIAKKSFGQFGDHLGTADQEQLRRGALDAFHAGNPHNIQTALSHLDESKIYRGSVNYNYENESNPRENIISTLIKESNDLSYVIENTVLADVGSKSRKAFLNSTLFQVLNKRITGGTAFITALLDAGADANAAVEGYKGFTLVRALENDQPLPVIELLHKKGASFDDAIESMKINGWADDKIQRMKFLREKFTGQPADDEKVTLAALRKEIAELREQLTAKQPTSEPVPKGNVLKQVIVSGGSADTKRAPKP